MSETAERNLRNVIVLALVDGTPSDPEMQCIESLRQRLGIDEAEFRRLCQEVRQDPKKLSLPADQAEAMETVALLAQVASADGVVNADELRVLQAVAQRAGLGEADLDRLLHKDQEEQAAHAERVEALVEDVYESFQSWDPATRQAKFDELGALGRAATIPLLRVFESYRRPRDAQTALDMKVLTAAQLGRIADRRAAYYLAQQISLGDMEDEVTSTALRLASIDALGKCVGQSFSPDADGLEAARQWWSGAGIRAYNQLAF